MEEANAEAIDLERLLAGISALTRGGTTTAKEGSYRTLLDGPLKDKITQVITTLDKQLAHCNARAVQSECLQKTDSNTALSCQAAHIPDLLEETQWLFDYSSDRIHSVLYKDVSTEARILHTICGLLLVIALLSTISSQAEREAVHIVRTIKEAIRILDLIIVVAGAPVFRTEIDHLVDQLQEQLGPVQLSTPTGVLWQIKEPIPQIHHPVPILESPSIISFTTHLYTKCTPVVIPNSTIHWPAMKKWQSLDYLAQRLGYRYLPVELGSSYTSTEWSQKLMTGREFFEEYFLKSVGADRQASIPKAYIAQHNLLSQVPRLMDDIIIPDYCFCSDNETAVEENDVIINTWFGVSGTVSPLHTDPHDNIFAQVCGYKYMRLYSPSETNRLSPFEGMMSNTSQVELILDDGVSVSSDERMEIDKRFPEFKNAVYTEVILKPGDLLFIPKGWWHYVKGLSESFSISFWF